MKTGSQATVWGIFVGEGGCELATFNAPFPPKPGTQGHVAIGWARMGDMLMYKDNYDDFLKKFRILYPHERAPTFTALANVVWNFAYVMKEGDYVISPSRVFGYVLVGRVVGEYQSDYDNWERAERKTNIRADLMHLRSVQWLYAIPKEDPRYQKIHLIGVPTVNRLSITVAELLLTVESEGVTAE